VIALTLQVPGFCRCIKTL